MIENAYEPAFYRPAVWNTTVCVTWPGYDGFEALSEIPVLDRSGPLNRLKLARAVCKALSRFIDVRSLVVHPSVTGLFYSRSKAPGVLFLAIALARKAFGWIVSSWSPSLDAVTGYGMSARNLALNFISMA